MLLRHSSRSCNPMRRLIMRWRMNTRARSEKKIPFVCISQCGCGCTFDWNLCTFSASIFIFSFFLLLSFMEWISKKWKITHISVFFSLLLLVSSWLNALIAQHHYPCFARCWFFCARATYNHIFWWWTWMVRVWNHDCVCHHFFF